MLLIDLEEGRIISDEEVKTEIANEFPYQKWLEEELVQVNPDPEIREENNSMIFSSVKKRLAIRMKIFRSI